MSARDSHLDLTRPLQSGVYDVDAHDFAALTRQARQAELALCRVDLTGCTDKAGLLRRLAFALRLPPDFGDNWDALADCLRDPAWRPAWGHVFVFEHPESLPPHDAAILRAVEELLADFAISDATWATLAASWDEQQMIELPMMVGQYLTTAFILNSLHVQLGAGNKGLDHR